MIRMLLLLTLLPLSGFSQVKKHRAGEMYLYWGWNRDAYSRSDLHFTGEDYDFTLYDVRAKERQEKFSTGVYFSPTRMTIPQYNFRLGVFLDDKYDLSFGIDHMKYVMRNDQEVLISGNISNSGTIYDGQYDEDPLVLSRDFLLFEHTDGLNYLNLELRRSDILFGRRFFRIESRVGAGAGALVPKTNTTLMKNDRYDEFHLAGYGLGMMGGLHFSLFNYFFIQFEAKGGFIHMPDIRTTMYEVDRASQHFFFVQVNGVFGFNFNLIRSNKPDPETAEPQ